MCGLPWRLRFGVRLFDCEPGQAVVDVTLSATNAGTERARYVRLPNARIGFPHVPGSGSVGRVIEAATGVQKGGFVAVRACPHQSVAAAAADRLHPVRGRTDPVDAALWQVGLIAMHGLGLGGFEPGEPLTVVGAGLIGAMTRRVALARGAGACTVLASSAAKRWSVATEPRTSFVSTGTQARGQQRHRLVVDATGTATGLDVAVSAVASGGQVVLLGSPRVSVAAVPLGEIYARRLRLVGAHIDTLPDVSAATGDDLLERYTEEFFTLIGSGRLTMADLMTVYTPGQADVLYQQLVSDSTLVGAVVDWTDTPTFQPATAPVNRRCLRAAEPPLRFGLVGCGDIGFQNAETLSRCRQARLVACHDSNPALSAALADHTEARTDSTLAGVLADPDVEAVIVATPHDTHEQIALATLAAGKHLLIQKPLAADLAAAERIAQAASRAALTTSVLLPGRYRAGYRNARRVWDEGLLGRPVAIMATYLVDKPASYYRGGYSMRSPSTWRMSRVRAGGGILIMNLLHHLDIAQSLVKREAAWVFSRMAGSAHSREIEDFAALMVGFGDVTATFIGAASVPGPPGEQFRAWGTSGHCAILPGWEFTSATDPDADVRVRPAPDDPDAAAIDGFAAAVRAGSAPDITVADALAVQSIVAAGYESAWTGHPVAPQALLGRRQDRI